MVKTFLRYFVWSVFSFVFFSSRKIQIAAQTLLKWRPSETFSSESWHHVTEQPRKTASIRRKKTSWTYFGESNDRPKFPLMPLQFPVRWFARKRPQGTRTDDPPIRRGDKRPLDRINWALICHVHRRATARSDRDSKATTGQSPQHGTELPKTKKKKGDWVWLNQGRKSPQPTNIHFHEQQREFLKLICSVWRRVKGVTWKEILAFQTV